MHWLARHLKPHEDRACAERHSQAPVVSLPDHSSEVQGIAIRRVKAGY